MGCSVGAEHACTHLHCWPSRTTWSPEGSAQQECEHLSKVLEGLQCLVPDQPVCGRQQQTTEQGHWCQTVWCLCSGEGQTVAGREEAGGRDKHCQTAAGVGHVRSTGEDLQREECTLTACHTHWRLGPTLPAAWDGREGSTRAVNCISLLTRAWAGCG